MKRVWIFGTGSYYHKRKMAVKKYEVIGFLDNNSSKWGNIIDGKPIVNPKEIIHSDYDKVMVASIYYGDIINQLLDMKVPADKIDILFSLPFNENYHIEIEDTARRINCQIDKVKMMADIYSYSDLAIISEIFEKGTYNFHIATSKEIVVIDIGMNIGIASLFFASKDNVKKVYSYEPFNPTYKKALNNFKINSDDIQRKICPFQLALGNHNEVKECNYLEDFSGNLSVLGDSVTILEELGHSKLESIEIKDAGEVLKPIIDKHKKDFILLKIDCEGSEYDIFESISKYNLLDDVSAILMEWHEFLDGEEGRHKELEKWMKDYNFSYGINGKQRVGMLYAFKQKI